MSCYSDLILSHTPSLYWRLGEPSGTNSNDETANNRDGTYVGTPTLGAAGAIVADTDTAVDLNGSTQYLTSSYSPFTAGTVRTFEGWAIRDVTTADHALVCDSATTVFIGVHITTAGTYFSPDNSAFVDWPANSWPNIGSWVHWVVIFDDPGNLATLYINGALVSAQACTAVFGATGTLRLGRWGGGSYWDGKMDEFAVYEAALTAAQIKEHYRVGSEQVIGNPMRAGF